VLKRLAALLSTSFIALFIVAQSAQADETGWPKSNTVNGYKYTIYQPQVDSWADYRTITAHVAVALTKPNETKQFMGVIALTAKTLTDFDKRAVQISDITVDSVNFPLLSADENAKMTAFVQANVKPENSVVPLDTILLNAERTKNTMRETKVDTTPPIIYTSQKPALLVVYDGDPIFSPVKEIESVDVQFAVNTNWNVLKSANTYYLLAGSSWLQSSAALGPWKPAGPLPATFKQLPTNDDWKDVRAALSASPVAAAQVPVIWVSTKPAEAIVIGGEPKLVAVAGTQLSFVDNTDATLLFYKPDKRWYYLSSGRWFSATGLAGPWAFANNNLPGDFLKIPADSQVGWVLPSVPGSPQAKEAILEAQVPREAWVDRTKATLQVTYTGDPQFKPIKDTSLEYAVNTDIDVIKAGDAYYACKDAVWFTSTAPAGPWTVADKIPPEIYNIPATSSVYQDTYVTVQDSTSSSVLFGFAAGWTMSYFWRYGYYYGPGYWYPPYYGMYGRYPWYYPWPRTYVGGVWYNPATGVYGRGFGVRGPYGGATIAGGVGPGGSYWRGGSVYGPYGGIGRVAIYNPVTGNYYRGVAAWGANGVYYRGQGGNRYGAVPTPYSSWGSAAQRPNVNVPSQRPATAQRPSTLPATKPSGTKPGGNGAVTQPIAARPSTGAGTADNVFAGRDGNVYKPGNNGSWSQFNNKANTWQPVATPPGASSPQRPANMPAQRPAQAPAARPAPAPAVNAQTFNQLQQASAARTQGAQNFGGVRGGGGNRGGRGG